MKKLLENIAVAFLIVCVSVLAEINRYLRGRRNRRADTDGSLSG